jgi:hypothetical protein
MDGSPSALREAPPELPGTFFFFFWHWCRLHAANFLQSSGKILANSNQQEVKTTQPSPENVIPSIVYNRKNPLGKKARSEHRYSRRRFIF